MDASDLRSNWKVRRLANVEANGSRLKITTMYRGFRQIFEIDEAEMVGLDSDVD